MVPYIKAFLLNLPNTEFALFLKYLESPKSPIFIYELFVLINMLSNLISLCIIG